MKIINPIYGISQTLETRFIYDISSIVLPTVRPFIPFPFIIKFCWRFYWYDLVKFHRDVTESLRCSIRASTYYFRVDIYLKVEGILRIRHDRSTKLLLVERDEILPVLFGSRISRLRSCRKLGELVVAKLRKLHTAV